MRCSAPLEGDDPEPLVHQVHELPDVRPVVTEDRRHRLTCRNCGAVACEAWPEGVSSGTGPRVEAMIAYFGGVLRAGKRPIAEAMRDLFGPAISPAAVCDRQAAIAKLRPPPPSR